MGTYLNKIYIIFDRELKGYFRTPLASIFLLVFLALSSGMTFFLGRFFERDQADLTAFFFLASVVISYFNACDWYATMG
jgi:ABC-2 type transport system permease protein